MDCVSVSSYQWVIWIIWMPITQLSPLSPKQSYTAERKSSLQYKVIVHNSIWKNLFPWKLQQIQRAQEHYLIEQILSYKTLFSNTVTTISCAFLLTRTRHSSWSDPLSPLLKRTVPPTTLLCSHPLFGPHEHPASAEEWGAILPTKRNSVTHSASDAPPCHAFCQTAPLLPSVTQQQHGTLVARFDPCCTPPTSAPDVVGQHNKTEGITFGAALGK